MNLTINYTVLLLFKAHLFFLNFLLKYFLLIINLLIIILYKYLIFLYFVQLKQFFVITLNKSHRNFIIKNYLIIFIIVVLHI